MNCAEINAMLPAYAGDELPLDVRRHLGRCPECRAELARYESLSGSLSDLSAHTVEVPASLRASLVAIPSSARRLDEVRSHVSRNRKTYAGLAVTVAGAAGAAVWRSRRRVATA